MLIFTLGVLFILFPLFAYAQVVVKNAVKDGIATSEVAEYMLPILRNITYGVGAAVVVVCGLIYWG